MWGLRARAIVGGTAVLALVVSAGPVAPALARPVPGTSCRVFPADHVWHLDVSRLPVHPRSDVWKRAMHAGSTRLHPDFGPPTYGMPFEVVEGTHRKVKVRFVYASESDPGPYPFDGRTPIEGGSDRHALIVDQDRCRLYELFGARWNDGRPRAGSGAVFDLRSYRLRPAGWTSADAAGLPILPGLLRYDEIRAGSIDHPIRFTASCTTRRYVWPARHQAGVADRRCPPMGAWFRLKAGFPLTGFSTDARVVLRGMKAHGLILADNGSDWFFQGTRDRRWTNALLDQLKRIPAGAFVAVDVRACRVGPDSGRFAYGPGCPAPR
jgi:hypothetical protein